MRFLKRSKRLVSEEVLESKDPGTAPGSPDSKTTLGTATLGDLLVEMNTNDVVLIAESVLNYSRDSPICFALISESPTVGSPALASVLKPATAAQRFVQLDPARHFTLNYEALRIKYGVPSDDEKFVRDYATAEIPLRVFRVQLKGVYWLPPRTPNESLSVADIADIPELRGERGNLDNKVVRCILASQIGLAPPLTRDQALDLVAAVKLFDVLPVSFKWLDSLVLTAKLRHTLDLLHRFYKLREGDSTNALLFRRRSRPIPSNVERELDEILDPVAATEAGDHSRSPVYRLSINNWTWRWERGDSWPIKELMMRAEELRRSVLAELIMRDLSEARRRVGDASVAEIERRAALPRPRSAPQMQRDPGVSATKDRGILKQPQPTQKPTAPMCSRSFTEIVIVEGRSQGGYSRSTIRKPALNNAKVPKCLKSRPRCPGSFDTPVTRGANVPMSPPVSTKAKAVYVREVRQNTASIRSIPRPNEDTKSTSEAAILVRRIIEKVVRLPTQLSAATVVAVDGNPQVANAEKNQQRKKRAVDNIPLGTGNTAAPRLIT